MNDQSATGNEIISGVMAPFHAGLPVGVDWLIKGILESEAGVDIVLASRAEPVPGLLQSLEKYADELKESGITVEMAESDIITAGLLRAALRAGRKVVALFEMRGMRQAMDALYEATTVSMSSTSGGVIVVCESRWLLSRRTSLYNESAGYSIGYQDTKTGGGVVQGAVNGGILYNVADARELGVYLGIPILAPADCIEMKQYVNEAMRLSRVSGLLPLLLLTPSLMGGGETEPEVSDPTLRPVTSALDIVEQGQLTSNMQMEARRRNLDRLINMPAPGEVVPLGFITYGTAHAALRHALNLLGLSGRIPILKLGYGNPIDTRSVEQFLVRCNRIVVFEGGRPVIERSVLDITREMEYKGLQPAEVFGKRFPLPLINEDNSNSNRNQESDLSHSQSNLEPDDSEVDYNFTNKEGIQKLNVRKRVDKWVSIPSHLELHPSELAYSIGLALAGSIDNEATYGKKLLAHQEMQERRLDLRKQYRKSFDKFQKVNSHNQINNLVHMLVKLVIQDITQVLQELAVNRPALNVVHESLDTASFEQSEVDRPVIEIDRRRLLSIGRAAITHAIRRNLIITFLIMPDASNRRSDISIADAERVVRSLIGDTDASQVTVSRLDPVEGHTFRTGLEREILNERVSVIIIDTDRHQKSENVAGDPQVWGELGYPPAEYWVRPTSKEVTLCYEWLTRRGWTDPLWLDGVHAPKFDLHDVSDPLITQLDGWEGFEELRVYRNQPPPESAIWLKMLPVDEPVQRHAKEPYWRVHLCGSHGEAFNLAVTLIEQTGRRMGYRVQLVRGRGIAGEFAQLLFSHPRDNESPDLLTARIPYGKADLVVALDSESLAEAIDPLGSHQVADCDRTHLIIDVSEPLILTLVEDSKFNKNEQLPAFLNDFILRKNQVIVQAGELSERILNTRRFAGVILLGIAFQKGLIPVTCDKLERSVQRMPGDPLQQALPAFKIGRSIANRPDGTYTTARHKLPRPEALVRLHQKIMAARPVIKAKRNADRFATLALGTLDAITGLRRNDLKRETELRFIARLIDCECWGGLRTCKLYAERIRMVYAAERSVVDYPVTRLVIEQLAKAILIQDMMFVCATVTRPDRLRANEHALRVARTHGDKLTYRLRTRPRSRIAGMFINNYWKLTPVMCTTIKYLKFLRTTPNWMKQEKQYRKWVLEITDLCISELPAKASLWLEVFRQLSRVQGFGRYRNAKVHRVRRAVDSLLAISSRDIGVTERSNNNL